MSVESKPSIAFCRKRLAIALAVASCALLGACGNDDKAPDARTASSIHDSTDSSPNDSAATALSANPPSAAPAPALTVQTPARPASSADAALSAAASAPLATPVIHTVD